MKNLKLIAIVFMSSVLLFTCAPPTEKTEEEVAMEVQRERETENQNLIEELVALRDNITEKSEKVATRMEKVDTGSKDELMRINKELNAQLKRVEASLDNVNSATEDNWEDIKVETKEMIAQVKEEGKSLNAKLDTLLEQTANNRN